MIFLQYCLSFFTLVFFNTAVINKNLWNKKLLFQATTFKNNLFNTKYVSFFFFSMYGPQEKYKGNTWKQL